MTHYYKGFEIRKNGTKKFPWNIYMEITNPITGNRMTVHVGFDKTLKACKTSIDEGCFVD